MARFAPGDNVTHNGRPATVLLVNVVDGKTRYGIEYVDAEGGGAGFPIGLLGRVLSPR